MNQPEDYSNPLSLEDRAHIWETIWILLGKEAWDWWNKDGTTDLHLDSRAHVRVRHKGRLRKVAELTPLNRDKAIHHMTSYVGDTLNDESWFVENSVSDGTRVTIVGRRGSRAPIMSLRKGGWSDVTFEELQKRGTYTAIQVAFLKGCARNRITVMFTGDTGSGKTTGVKAYLNEQRQYGADRRYIIIQDRDELNPNLENAEYLFSRPKRGKAPKITFAKQLVRALSLDPDIIVCGEVRDAKTAAKYREALHTGHRGGCESHHAESLEDSYWRYYYWDLERGVNPVPQLIGRDMPVVVYCSVEEGTDRFTVRVGRYIGFDKDEQQFLVDEIDPPALRPGVVQNPPHVASVPTPSVNNRRP